MYSYTMHTYEHMCDPMRVRTRPRTSMYMLPGVSRGKCWFFRSDLQAGRDRDKKGVSTIYCKQQTLESVEPLGPPGCSAASISICTMCLTRSLRGDLRGCLLLSGLCPPQPNLCRTEDGNARSCEIVCLSKGLPEHCSAKACENLPRSRLHLGKHPRALAFRLVE